MIFENGYKTKTGFHCLIGCVEAYCLYWGCSVAGQDIFFESDGFDLNYINDSYKSFSLSSYADFSSVLADFGILYDKITLNKDILDIKDYLIDQIYKEKALIIIMDSLRIPYDNVFRRNKQTRHTMNLIGYNHLNDTFCISDCFIPSYEPYSKQIWIDANEFISAWDNCNKLITLDYTKGDVVLNTKNKVIEQLNRYLNDTTSIEGVSGKNAIKKLLDDLEIMLYEKCDIRTVIELNYQFRVNGFFMGREYLCEFLLKEGCLEYYNNLSQILINWKNKCLALTKYVMIERTDKIKDVIQAMKMLCEEEEILFYKIMKKLQWVDCI